jgi:hypothetical protein
MKEVILIPATESRNGLTVRKVNPNGNINSVEVRKISHNGRENGYVATINKSGEIVKNALSWRGSTAAYDMPEGVSLDALVKVKWEDIKQLF